VKEKAVVVQYESDDEDDLAIEIELRVPEVEDLVVPDDSTWKNFGSFVYKTEVAVAPSPAPPSRSHVTRRQSVAQGVQMLHQMAALQNEPAATATVLQSVDYVLRDNDDDDVVPPMRVNSTNSLEYDDHELFQREEKEERCDLEEKQTQWDQCENWSVSAETVPSDSEYVQLCK